MQNFTEHDQSQSPSGELAEFQQALSVAESLQEPVLRDLGSMALNSGQIEELLETAANVRQGLDEVLEVGQVALLRAQEAEAAAAAAAEAAVAAQPDYDARVLEWVEANRRDTFSIGHIAGERLPDDEFERLKDALNANPLLSYSGQGWYAIDMSALHVEPTTPEAAAAGEQVPDAAEAAGRTEPEAPVSTETEVSEPVDKQKILFERVEEFAWNRGAFSADDLRSDPLLGEVFTDEELRSIGKSLPALRKLVLARVEEVGGKARWMSEKVGGKTKYILAFYTRPDRETLTPYVPEEVAKPEPKPEPASPTPEPIRRARRRPSEVPVVAKASPAVLPKLVETPDMGEPVPTTPAYDIVGLLHDSTRLGSAEKDDARRQIVALFGDSVQMPREEMSRIAALRWGVAERTANEILQAAYRLRLVGRLPESPDVFSLDPSQRRRRGKAGGASESQETGSSEPEEIDPLKLGFEGIMNYLAGQKHIEAMFTPAAIANELNKEGGSLTREDVKAVVKHSGSVFIRSPRLGQRFKIGLANQTVKAAWKRDPPGFTSAVRDGKIDEYLAAYEPKR